MSRRHLTFDCEGSCLVGTLDDAPGKTGLLIVSGGNETRAGAFSGQAELASRIAQAGLPVFRFDRRGVGDSEGANQGFRSNAKDIAAALSAFKRSAPEIDRVVALGNCDAASALMLAAGEGFDGLVLSNPWTIDGDDGQLTPDEIRKRYGKKLRNPREWLRLASGNVSIGKLLKGLKRAAQPEPDSGSLIVEMAHGLGRFEGPAMILLAERDRTAQVFRSGWSSEDWPVEICPGASHGFAEEHARNWLLDRVLAALNRTF